MEKKEILKEFKQINLKKELDKVSKTLKVQNVILTELRRFIRQIFFYDVKQGIFFINNMTSKIIQDAIKQGTLIKHLSDECQVKISEQFNNFLINALNVIFEAKYQEKKEITKNSTSVKLLNILNNQILSLINYNKLMSKELKMKTDDFEFLKVDRTPYSPEEIQEILQNGDLREIVIVEKKK